MKSEIKITGEFKKYTSYINEASNKFSIEKFDLVIRFEKCIEEDETYHTKIENTKTGTVESGLYIACYGTQEGYCKVTAKRIGDKMSAETLIASLGK